MVKLYSLKYWQWGFWWGIGKWNLFFPLDWYCIRLAVICSWTFLNSGLSISSCEPQLTPSSCEPGSWAAVYRYQNMCLCHIYNMLHAFVLSFRYVSLVTGTCSPNSWASNINPGNIWFYLIFYLIFIYRRSIGSCEPWFTAKVHGSWALNHEPWPSTLMIWLTRHQITANPNTVGDRLD